jgi:serine/threonine-protein kinase
VRAARAPGRIDPNEYQIAVVDLETGLREVLVPGVFARYAMSGHLVYVTEDGALMAAPFDPDALRLGDPRVLAEGISIGGSESVNLALSAGGTLIYQTGSPSAGRGEFIWVTRSGDAVPVHQGWTVSYYSSANAGWSLSPDDTRAVFSQVLQGNQDVWLKVLPDGPESRLTFSEATDRMPRWAPDGQTITFRSDRTEPLVGHLWSKRADGAGEAEVLFDQEAIAFGFWGPTGEWLILRRAGAAGVEGARDVLALRPGIDSTAIPLIADDRLMEQGPAISPDGRWIAYSSNETGRDEIFVRPFPGVESGRWQVSTEGGIKPVWSHSGREIFFVDAGNSMTAAAVETDPTVVVVERQKLFVLPPGTVVAPNADFYDVTSDDQRFLMVREIPDDPAGSPHRTVLVHNFFEELKRLVPN